MAAEDITGKIINGTLELQGTDLSSQVMTSIFGENWWNLLASSGGGANGFLYEMLRVLNSACGVVVAWLMILTVLIATTGAAQEGRSIGGRYSSVWVPLRFSFAFAAITPVLNNGLCALQALILACAGVSIDLANTMWKTAVDEIAKGKSILLVPPENGALGQDLAFKLVKNQTLIYYLASEAGCSNLPYPTSVEKYAEDDDRIVYIFRNTPNALQCINGTKEIWKTSFGTITVEKNGSAELANVQESAINTLLGQLAPVSQSIAEHKPDSQMVVKVAQAGANYAKRVNTFMQNYVSGKENPASAIMQAYAQEAKNLGWFSAGSFYWTLSTMSQDAIARMIDHTSVAMFDLKSNEDEIDFNGNIVRRPASPLTVYQQQSWFQNVAPNLEILAAGSTTVRSNVSLYEGGGSKDFFDVINQVFSRMGAMLTDFVKDVANGLSGTDALVFIVQSGRLFTESCVACMAALALLGWVSTSLASFLYLVVGALWAFGAFICYVVPAMPFLIWVAAIVGWIVLTMESVIAAPLWLVGHAMPEGEGFAGQHGRAGYMLLFGVLLRPMLLVLSMCLCILLMKVTGTFLGPLFVPFVEAMRVLGNVGIVGMFFLFILMASTVALLSWKMFDLVTAMPDRIIRWVGQTFVSLGNEAAQAQGRDVIGLNEQAAGRAEHVASGTFSKNGPLGNFGRRNTPKEGGGNIGSAVEGGRNEVQHMPSNTRGKNSY